MVWPILAERRQLGGDHDTGHIFDIDIALIERHPQILHHIDQTLTGEGRPGTIAGAVKADYEPIADQLVVADSSNRGQILQSCCARLVPS